MASGIKAYPFDEFEPKWQNFWLANKTFKSVENSKPKYYILDMFPYPSGSGLHVGHLEGYTATDIIARYKRMRGFNVLHPMGWDAFGLPAEQHALDTGTHPAVTTAKNVSNFKRQINQMGFSYDWDREVNTTDPKYYRWTQWIFSKLYEKGLAYEAEVAVNWCPALGTVLANEEVIDGKSERGNHPVIRKPMRQWVLKITAYAERLLEDLNLLDWPEAIKDQQRNWIGKSVGAEIDFRTARTVPGTVGTGSENPSHNVPGTIKVYTTRPDTLFGATYMVLAPEHPLVSRIVLQGAQLAAVEEYVKKASRKSDLERTDLAKDKTGVFTGAYAINPVNGRQIPIWIADYVLISYGTGAIMAVPAHDERDWEFAKKFGLPIVEVIKGGDVQKEAFTGEGTAVNSDFLNGLKTDEAKEKMTQWLEQKGIGKKSVQYKLRDWLFSRQRYWGEPIPVIHVEGKPKLLPANHLPILLPETNTYKPTGTGESPLAAITEWVETKDSETGKPAKRETNTMPQWAGSCWYYLRYIDPNNDQLPIAKEKDKYWMPVDLYVGGAEHAVLHLLYSRFWHKVLYDCGVVGTKEPFQRLVNQGMILGEDNQKMSKSRGNVINPDDLVKSYGADSIRLYEMFMGPLEMTKPWSMQGVEGVYRFLARVWRLFCNENGELLKKNVRREPTAAEQKRIHQTIKKVTDDLENIRLNTAISAVMVFVNETVKDAETSFEILEKFVLILAPFAPHMAEELWNRLGHNDTLTYEPWPAFNPQFLIEDEFEMAVLVGGKVRCKLMVSKDLTSEQIQALAWNDDKVKTWLQGNPVKKVIVVPKRTINIVV